MSTEWKREANKKILWARLIGHINFVLDWRDENGKNGQRDVVVSPTAQIQKEALLHRMRSYFSGREYEAIFHSIQVQRGWGVII